MTEGFQMWADPEQGCESQNGGMFKRTEPSWWLKYQGQGGDSITN